MSQSMTMSDASLQRGPARRLHVDADTVLLPSGLFWECLVEALRRTPAIVLWLPLWMLRGRAFLKAEVARRSGLNPARLPYCTATLADLHRRASAGVSLVMVTKADQSAARMVAAYLGIFDEVVASPDVALAGGESLTNRRAVKPADLLRALRPQQWLKNTLVFLPFLLSHHIRSLHAWGAAWLAFAAFSFCASFGYIVNDIFDRHQDRLHPVRKLRPIAAGEVPLGHALFLLLPLLLLTALCCAFLPWEAAAVLLWYLGATVFYSAVAKERLMADVIVLALLYTSRLLMGSFATGNQVSTWLAGFSLTLFLSIALCKRVSELITWRSQQYGSAPGRKYEIDDIPILETMAVSSGFLACLIMVLYVQSTEILTLYRHPQYLWVGVVGLLYWLGRLVIWTHRGKCPDDPLFFALQDKTTLLVLLIAAAFGALAI